MWYEISMENTEPTRDQIEAGARVLYATLPLSRAKPFEEIDIDEQRWHRRRAREVFAAMVASTLP